MRVPKWSRPALLAVALGASACERLAGPDQYGSVAVATVQPDGTPVPDVPVVLYTGDRPLQYAQTDYRGRYLFERVTPAPGNYGVIATVPLAYRDSGDSGFVGQDRLDVVPRTVEPVRLVIAPCAGVVAVSVVDGQARAAAGVALRLYGGGADDRSGTTGMDGTFRFTGLSCGEYGVQVLPTPGFVIGSGRGLSFVDGLRLHRGLVLGAAFTVQQCRGSIRVLARDATGAGVPGATVTVYSPAGKLGTALTGSDGRAVFTVLPCGIDLGVALESPAGFTVPSGRGSSFFDGIRLSNGSVTDVTFTLAKS